MRIFYCIIICNFLLVSCYQNQKKNYGVPPDMTIDANTIVDYNLVNYYSIRYCLTCHIDRTGPNLSTYESLAASANKVVSAVKSTGDMPPVSQGFSKLTACQQLVINTWIARGMPNAGLGTIFGSAGAGVCY